MKQNFDMVYERSFSLTSGAYDCNTNSNQKAFDLGDSN